MQQYQSNKSVLSDEFERKRKMLQKALEQGEQINNLEMAPEWEFFKGWLEASRKELTDRVVGENFIRDHNGYLFTVGAIRAIDQIINGIEGFKKTYNRASKQMLQLQKDKDMTE